MADIVKRLTPQEFFIFLMDVKNVENVEKNTFFQKSQREMDFCKNMHFPYFLPKKWKTCDFGKNHVLNVSKLNKILVFFYKLSWQMWIILANVKIWVAMLKREINISCNSFFFFSRRVMEKAYDPQQRFLDPQDRFLRLQLRFRSGSASPPLSPPKRSCGSRKVTGGQRLFRDPRDKKKILQDLL